MKVAASHDAPWRVILGDFTLDKGRASFVDRHLVVPAALEVLDLTMQAHGWALDTLSAVPFHLAARVAVPAGPSGKAAGAGIVGNADLRGELKDFVSGVPANAKATVLLKDLPLHLLDPYLDDLFSVDVHQAQTGFKGDLAWSSSAAGPSLVLHGDATIDDFRATSAAADRTAPSRGLAMVRDGPVGQPLLNWKSLSLRGIDVAVAPGKTTRIAVAETALSDFYARVVLDENGRLNLQDAAQPSGPAAAASPAGGAASSVAVASAAAAGSAPASSSNPAVVSFGPIAVVTAASPTTIASSSPTTTPT